MFVPYISALLEQSSHTDLLWKKPTSKKAPTRQKGKGSFYIAQYPVRRTAQSALHFLPSLTDLLIPTPTRLHREAF